MNDLEAIKAECERGHGAKADILPLVAEVERLQADNERLEAGWMEFEGVDVETGNLRPSHAALLKALEDVRAELARAVAEAREECRQIAEEFALRYSGYGHEPEMDTAIEISNAIKALMCEAKL